MGFAKKHPRGETVRLCAAEYAKLNFVIKRMNLSFLGVRI